MRKSIILTLPLLASVLAVSVEPAAASDVPSNTTSIKKGVEQSK